MLRFASTEEGRPRCPRVIVVVPPKAGTNLIARLMEQVGYRPVGLGIGESYDELFAQVERRWGSRHEFTDPAKLFSVLLEDFPGSRSLFLHHLPRGPYLDGWVDAREPPIIFQTRDPRAVAVSWVHYLTTPEKWGRAPRTPWRLTHASRIAEFESTAERIRYVLRAMPDYFDKVFRQHTWLLEQPGVCRTTYEELVGSAGGGSDARQLAGVEKVLAHLGCSDRDPKSIASGLYDRNTRTFRQGTIDGWRSEFSPSLLELFDELYGDILTRYEYQNGTGGQTGPDTNGP